MIEFWLKYLKNHPEKTVDDVPLRWRSAVRAALEAKG